MLGVSAMGALGNAGLLIVLAGAVVGGLSTGLAIVTGNARGIRQAPNYAVVIAIGALVAVVAMQVALQQRDYTLSYIQQVGSSATPPLYNVAAMWSALKGSLLLWVAVLAGFTAAVAWRSTAGAKLTPEYARPVSLSTEKRTPSATSRVKRSERSDCTAS